MDTANEPLPAVTGFDPAMAGKRAECDGGGQFGVKYLRREDFAGTLTGEYVDHGDPPWRWYLMNDLRVKPDHYLWDSVWCMQGNLYVESGE
jgi:hypothetical protein